MIQSTERIEEWKVLQNFGVSNLCGDVPQTRRLGEITITNQRRYYLMAGENVVGKIRGWVTALVEVVLVSISPRNRTTGPFWIRRSILTRGCDR